MMIETGTCIYCGQMQQFEVEDGSRLSEEEKNRKATEHCTCPEAEKKQDSVQVKTKTQENITRLLHADQPVMEEVMKYTLPFIQEGELTEVVLKAGAIKSQMRMTPKGKIQVAREKKVKTTLENQ